MKALITLKASMFRHSLWTALFWVVSVSITLIAALSASAQGTIQFGFEEFAIGSTPPFVKTTYPPGIVGPNSSVVNSVSGVQPFEGDKFLWTSGGILLKSPDGQPIQSYTLHFFIPSQPNLNLQFGLSGKTDPKVIQTDSWQTILGSFSSPVEGVDIGAIIEVGGERFAAGFAIDAVEFDTVPEPQTFWLLTLGLAAISSHAVLKRPKPNRA